MLVGLEEAQDTFSLLPPSLQLPTLSPAYCAADARREADLTPRFLLFRSGAAFLLHSLHEASVPGGGTDWQSPYGYGGPIGVGMTGSLLQAAWAQFDRIACEQRVVAEFVRFHPLADNQHLYPGTIRDDRPVVSIDLSAADLAATYTVRGRNTLRKAQQAGLAASWQDPHAYCGEFTALYRAAMQRIGAGEFYLFGPDYFEALCAWSCTRILTVTHAGEVVAAAAFLFGSEVIEYHLSATTPAGRTLGATNLLLHAAARTGQEQGLRRLYLGGGTDSRPDNPLLRFKQSFAEPTAMFRFGSRVIDALRYESLRRQFPELAHSSRRVLFYRSN